MLNTLKELCLLNGVSPAGAHLLLGSKGKSHVQRQVLLQQLEHHGAAHPKGRKSTGNRLMLCAHMDEVGIIVTRITDEGFLKFAGRACPSSGQWS